MTPQSGADTPIARRRTHRKSRFGCTFCKGRRIKCDELRPACSNCVIRGLVCSLGASGPPAAGTNGAATDPEGAVGGAASSGLAVQQETPQSEDSRSSLSVTTTPGASSSSQQLPQASPHAPYIPHIPPLPPLPAVRSSPQWGGRLFPLAGMGMAAAANHAAQNCPPPVQLQTTDSNVGTAPPLSPNPTCQRTGGGRSSISGGGGGGGALSLDLADLELFHHFCTFTASMFGHTRATQRFWSISAPQVGFRHPFVLRAILAVAGLHRAQLASDPAKLAALRSKVELHWDAALRLATPLLGTLNADNCDALHVFTGLTCVHILARGPQPGSYLLFDAAASPPGGGDGRGEAGKRTSSTEEWILFFRGLRSVTKATEATRKTAFGIPTSQSQALMDQMFGPDASVEDGEQDESHEQAGRRCRSDSGSVGLGMDHGNNRERRQGGSSLDSLDGMDVDVDVDVTEDGTSNAGSAPGGGGSSNGGKGSAIRAPSPFALGPAQRSEPMRELADLLRAQVLPARSEYRRDLAIYDAAFADLASYHATVFDSEGRPRHRGAQVVFGWMYHVSDEFVALVTARRPLALVMFAHFVVLLGQLDLRWVVQRWPEHIMAGIYDALGPAERLWIRWPMERVGWLPE